LNGDLFQQHAGKADRPMTKPVDQLYLELLPKIDRMAEHACRRFGLRREEVKDFKQELCLKLLANDYAVLHKHLRKSKIETYLKVVIDRAALDYINHLWGKWRPTEPARRLGKTAMALERLLVRDGCSFGEACQILRTAHGCKESDEELERLAAGLPPRRRRRPDAALDGEGSSGPGSGNARRGATEPPAGPLSAHVEGADEGVWNAERSRRRERVLAALAAALDTLPEEDRFIVRARAKGVPVVQIARSLEIEQKPLYSRLEKIRKTLRQELERAGVDREDVADILDHGDS
jgi:RNA polymerase sigma factor (sigma-70 family)